MPDPDNGPNPLPRKRTDRHQDRPKRLLPDQAGKSGVVVLPEIKPEANNIIARQLFRGAAVEVALPRLLQILVTEGLPTRDWIEAAKVIVNIGLGAPTAAETADAAKLSAADTVSSGAALARALAEPSVRAWLERARPDLVARLADTAQVSATVDEAATQADTPNPPKPQ